MLPLAEAETFVSIQMFSYNSPKLSFDCILCTEICHMPKLFAVVEKIEKSVVFYYNEIKRMDVRT